MILFVRASSHYVLLPASNLINNVAGACICGWVIHNSNGAANNDRLLSIGMSNVADNTRAGLGIRQAGGNLYMAGRTATGDPGGIINSTAIVPLSILTHIAVNISYTGVQASFYLNGAFVDTFAGDWTAGNTQNVNSLASSIGASAAGARFYMDGSIDDVRLYNRMLSASELATIYACRGGDGIFYGCLGRWQLYEKQSGYVCVGTESVKNIAEGGVNGTPVAGCTYTESQLLSRRRG